MNDMKKFIGTKTVIAKPMTRGKYNEYRGWDMPADEDPWDDGYLVEYLSGGKSNDERHEGYISWSPKAVFEEAYKEVKSIDQMIAEKDLNAPRITLAHIESVIKSEAYFVFPGTQLTVCCLTLRNGFNVTGESACASPENFDEEVGRAYAREHAFEKIWQLEGYLLKEKLFRVQ